MDDVEPRSGDDRDADPGQQVREIAEHQIAEECGGQHLEVMQRCQRRGGGEGQRIAHRYVADRRGNADAGAPEPEDPLGPAEAQLCEPGHPAECQQRQTQQRGENRGVELHRHRVDIARQRPRQQDVKREADRRAEREEGDRAEMGERGLDHKERADEAHHRGGDAPRPDLFMQHEAADEQDHEGLGESDGEGIGDRHHLHRGNEAIGRGHRDEGACHAQREHPPADPQRQPQRHDERRHQQSLHDIAAKRDRAHRHRLRGQLRGDVDQRRQCAEGEHQGDAGKDAVRTGHPESLSSRAGAVHPESDDALCRGSAAPVALDLGKEPRAGGGGEIEHRAVGETTRGHALMHAADHHLGRRDRARQRRGEGLAQLVLRPHPAGRGHRAGDDQHRLVLQRRGEGRARGPVDGVLQHAGGAVVVFGRDHDQPLGRLDRGAQRGNGRGARFDVEVLIVKRQRADLRCRGLGARRDLGGDRLEHGGTIGGLAQASGDAQQAVGGGHGLSRPRLRPSRPALRMAIYRRMCYPLS
ncbi:hypothetical protein SDC9_30447 [bioreactor metagenome]|uniref:Uncharacterized protein n=1 Tax=bioreactor metagenome TaxID=1076179 RepID=A0A644V0R1_9ZZZZ